MTPFLLYHDFITTRKLIINLLFSHYSRDTTYNERKFFNSIPFISIMKCSFYHTLVTFNINPFFYLPWTLYLYNYVTNSIINTLLQSFELAISIMMLF